MGVTSSFRRREVSRRHPRTRTYERRLRLEVLEQRLPLDGGAVELFQLSPALFVENQGQWADSSVRFVHEGDGANVAMTDGGPVFQLFRREAAVSTDDPSQAALVDDALHHPDRRFEREEDEVETLVFSASFEGANRVAPVGLKQSEAVFNYFVGDEATWHSEVPTYEVVAYQGLYQGIDLHTWGQRNSLKYEFHVAPGADWSQIRVRYSGIEGLALNEDGALSVNLGEDWRALIDDAPYIYQEIDGQQVGVAGRFVLLDEWTYAFEVLGDYDPQRALVIDPDLDWSTYLGGSQQDSGDGVAVDDAGYVYVTGFTSSPNWTGGGFDTSLGGGDAFVTKLTPSGDWLWRTYLGGDQHDFGSGIVVEAGVVYVTGGTYSPGWTSGGFDTSYSGGDGFVAKLNASTGKNIWSTYLGGSQQESADGITVDKVGNVYVTGHTYSSGWTSGGFDTTFNGDIDAFVAKLTPSGAHLWSTYLGGNDWDIGKGIAVDGVGNIYVTGRTYSAGWTIGGFDTTFAGSLDAFVAKLSASGGHLWSTFLGGNDSELAVGIAVDGVGNVYVTGYTDSPGWISGGFDTTFGGSLDAFVAKLSASGGHVWSTYLGGSNDDYGWDVTVDGAGDLYVTGFTGSPGWVSGGFDTSFNGGESDVFAAKLSASGGHLWSTYLGGSDTDRGYGIAADGTGNIYVSGDTFSSGWTSGGFDTSFNGATDAFVARIRTVPPKVVNVVTHGFNPKFNRTTENWEEFRELYVDLGAKLESLALGSPVSGLVNSYVHAWDSSSGFFEAVVLGALAEIAPLSKGALLLAAKPFTDLDGQKAIAGRHAENAARDIVQYITSTPGFLAAPGTGQVIHLIGHSRGAAVNALVSKQLFARGYVVSQYTALDGYATDWPGISGKADDISIVSEAIASRKVNYIVQDGLGAWILDEINSRVQSKTGLPLTSATEAKLAEAMTLWKAPIRAGFEDILMSGDSKDARSNHITATPLYLRSNSRENPSQRYIKDNFVGNLPHTAESFATLASAEGIENTNIQATGDGAARNSFSHFSDGSFDTLGDVLRQLQQADFPDLEPELVEFVMSFIRNPQAMLAGSWLTTGDAKLAFDGDDAMAELVQTGDTSLGQPLVLGARAKRVEFDLAVVSAGAGDKLEVVFRGEVIGTVALDSAGANGLHSFLLDGKATLHGDMTFRLAGPVGDPAVIRLDDLRIGSDAPSFIKGFDQSVTDESGQRVVADWAKNFVAEEGASFAVSAGQPGLFAAQPVIDASGGLTFTPQPNAKGTVIVTVTLNDGGDAPNVGGEQTFTIDVTKPHPWHNSSTDSFGNLDVNGKDGITVNDAVMVINYLNSAPPAGTGSVPASAFAAAAGVPGVGYIDVAIDGMNANFISVLDALLVINRLNSPGGEGEGEVASDQGPVASGEGSGAGSQGSVAGGQATAFRSQEQGGSGQGKSLDDLMELLAIDAAELTGRRRRGR